MERFRELSLESRCCSTHHYRSGLVDQNCSSCYLALASDAVAALDPEFLMSLADGTLGSVQLYANQDFRLVWSFAQISRNDISLT